MERETKHFVDTGLNIDGRIELDLRTNGDRTHYVYIRVRSPRVDGSLRDVYNSMRRLERAILKRFKVDPDKITADLEADSYSFESWGEIVESPVLSFTLYFYVSEIPEEDYKMIGRDNKYRQGFYYKSKKEVRRGY